MILLLTLGTLAAKPLPLAVETVSFAPQGIHVLDDGSVFTRHIENALGDAGLELAKRTPYFFDSAPPDAPLRLGARIHSVHCLPISAEHVECRVHVEWELLHRPLDHIVYRTADTGVGRATDLEEAGVEAMVDASARLARHVNFAERLDAGFYPSPLEATDLSVCSDAEAGAATLQGGSDDVQVLVVDPRGKVLVIGETDERVAIAVPGGATFDAQRVAGVEDVGLYEVPVHGGLGCTPDDTPLPDNSAGIPTVGEALATLGMARKDEPTPPAVLFDKRGTEARGSLDESLVEEFEDVR